MEGGVTLSDDSALCLATWCHISSQCDRALRQRAEWEVIRRRIGYAEEIIGVFHHNRFVLRVVGYDAIGPATGPMGAEPLGTTTNLR